MKRWHARYAWLGGEHAASNVLLEVDGDALVGVVVGVAAPPDAVRWDGLVIPGLVNGHSHAFHRALRGRTQSVSGDFWTWRDLMYRVVGALDPDRYRRLTRAVYLEMVAAGITAVGEFHYLHHAPGGAGYANANEMALASVDAAAEAGLCITLLDACYLASGFGDDDLDPAQRRFSDGSVGRWAERVDDLAATLETRAHARVGTAIHSVRAVPADGLGAVAIEAERLDAPLHVHLSEQPAENDACLAATGLTPTQLLRRHEVLSARTTAVHATHVNLADVAALAASGAAVCLCPTTEADLADGVGPAHELVSVGAPLALGSDSQAAIDLFAEARAVELHDRLRTGRRGLHAPADLLAAATAGGASALGWESGALTVGARADFVHLDVSTSRLGGFVPDAAAAHVVFAAGAADVRDVVVGGRVVVADRAHVSGLDPGHELDAAVADVWEAVA